MSVHIRNIRAVFLGAGAERNLDYGISSDVVWGVVFDGMLGHTFHIDKVFGLCEPTCGIQDVVGMMRHKDTNHTWNIFLRHEFYNEAIEENK